MADSDIFEIIFSHILSEAIKAGFVDTIAVFIDVTNIKVNANNKKYVNKLVKAAAKNYQKELTEEINEDRCRHGKQPLKGEKSEDDGNSNNKSGFSVADTKILRKAQPPLSADCSTRISIRLNLPIRRTSPAISIISSLILMWHPGTYMTAKCLTDYTRK